MNDSQFNVLLYSDGSHQAFSAAVYTATLLENMPDMHLTVLRVIDNSEAPAFKAYDWTDTWPGTPTSEWMKHVLSDSDSETEREYHMILRKTNQIFFNQGYNVVHKEIYTKGSGDNAADTTHIEDVILEYAHTNCFDLIIIGTRGLSSLKGLIFGSLAHNLLTKSTIPVMLIKKLPQEFIDSYLENKEDKVSI
ncbi:universal stress protein UspA-like protein [Desulfosporosinus acidiphilus SJ4]|uniref:Universal stress protein UspA-like protein n=1 Tax=Desulfosporosinus acidiphilus (strain DSM 22704 / JCM 16185 / SJ4) TaxID=646529 RepID=I4D659_DESAJ|nr:universal stress protein [Desulfosporosinus acidiphilus]AFM41283.1 universal stress protein UspA-like protein [Desulfosporosinus acidiphilus SJ4]